MITWDEVGTRKFESGVDHGVLYYYDKKIDDIGAVPWNGLISIDDTSKTPETEESFLDGVKYLNRRFSSEYSGKITAFTYPDQFEQFNGIVQSDGGISFPNQEVTDTFDMSYRSFIGNDTAGAKSAYRIHLLYNLTAVPSDVSYKSDSDSIDPINFEWDISGIPELLEGFRPTAHVILNSTKVDKDVMAYLEQLIYGNVSQGPRLPTAKELVGMAW